MRFTCHPWCVEGLDTVDGGDEGRQGCIPASHHEVDLGLGGVPANFGDRVEGHDQVPYALQPKQEYPPRHHAVHRSHPPEDYRRRDTQHHIAERDEGTLPPVLDQQMIEHRGFVTVLRHLCPV